MVCAWVFCLLTIPGVAVQVAFAQAAPAAAASHSPGTQQTGTANAPQARAVSAAQLEPDKTTHGNGPHEGIKVNGYWKIDVRNPDGTLAKHVEFENSLTYGGAVILDSLLTGQQASLGFSVYVGNVQTDQFLGGADYPIGGGPCGNACVISAPGSASQSDCLYKSANMVANYQSAECVATLSLLLNQDFSISLNGSFTASSNATVAQVSTIVTLCALNAVCVVPTPLGSASTHSIDHFLTTYLLGTGKISGLSVAVGQAVNISVTLSFQ